MRAFGLFSLLATIASASPVNLTPRGSSKTKECIVPASGGGDDSPAIAAAAAECSKDATIIFQDDVD